MEEEEETTNQFWVELKTLTELADDGWKVQGDQLIHRKYIAIEEEYKYLLGRKVYALITWDGKYFSIYEFPSFKFSTAVLKDGGLKFQIHLMKKELGLYEK